eukprot:PhM_4_TR2101/c2_g1_i2/m.6472
MSSNENEINQIVVGHSNDAECSFSQDFPTVITEANFNADDFSDKADVPLSPIQSLWQTFWLLLSADIENVDEADAVLVQAFMTLATAGWNGFYEHFSLSFLRDAYFRGDLDLAEVRGVVFMFLLQVLARRQRSEQAVRSMSAMSNNNNNDDDDEIEMPCEDAPAAKAIPFVERNNNNNNGRCVESRLLERGNPSDLVEEITALHETTDAALLRIFRSYHPDPQTGTISVAAFKRAYGQLERFGLPPPTAKELDDMVRRHHHNNNHNNDNNGVSYEEFAIMMLAHVRQ